MCSFADKCFVNLNYKMSASPIPPDFAKLPKAEVANGADGLESISLPFPAVTKQAAGIVGEILTDVMAISFSDRILVTITQSGKLAQWVGMHSRVGSPLAPRLSNNPSPRFMFLSRTQIQVQTDTIRSPK